MKKLRRKIALLLVLCLPLTANAVTEKNEPSLDKVVEQHLQQIDASWKAEIQFLQSITDDASVAGREDELFNIYKLREKHQQSLIEMARDKLSREESDSTFKKLMNIRLGSDDALMKELLRLKDNAKVSALRSEAHERSRSNKEPEMTLDRVLVAGDLAASDALLLNDHEQMLDQIDQELAQWHDIKYEQQEYVAVKISHILKSNASNARAYVVLAHWYLNRGYVKDRFYEPEPYKKAKFCNDQAMKLEPGRVSAWSQKILMAKTFLDAGTIQSTLDAHAAELEDTFPEKADALLWLYDNRSDRDAYARLVTQLAEKVRQGVATQDPGVKRYGLVMEPIQEYYLRNKDLKTADQFFEWHRAWRNDHAWVLGNYANVRLRKTGDYETSIALLEAALKKMDYGIGRKNLARAYYVASVMEKRNLHLMNAGSYKLKFLQSGFKEAEFIPEMGHFNHAPTVAAIMDDFGKDGIALRDNTARRTALHFAALDANLETVRVLLDLGANVQAFDDTDHNALFYAAKNNDVEMLKLVVGKGADVTVRSPQIGATPLHVAANYGSVAAADFLLSNGADINALNLDRCTPLVNAMLGGHLAMAKYLVSKNADLTVPLLGDASLKDLAHMGVNEDIKLYIDELFPEKK